MSDDEIKRCEWCKVPLVGVKSSAKFCSTSHRMKFHRALKAYGGKLYEMGMISIDDVKRVVGAVNGSPGHKDEEGEG